MSPKLEKAVNALPQIVEEKLKANETTSLEIPEIDDDEISSLEESEETKNEILSESTESNILEIDDDDLTDMFATTISDVETIPPATISKDEIRSLVRSELESVMREIFWEEAPKIIKDVVEQEIKKVAGE